MKELNGSNSDSSGNPKCCICSDHYNLSRMHLGFLTCRTCGEKAARLVKHTVVPMPKSNYILVTDMSLLKGLNSSHKGGR